MEGPESFREAEEHSGSFVRWLRDLLQFLLIESESSLRSDRPRRDGGGRCVDQILPIGCLNRHRDRLGILEREHGGVVIEEVRGVFLEGRVGEWVAPEQERGLDPLPNGRAGG